MEGNIIINNEDTSFTLIAISGRESQKGIDSERGEGANVLKLRVQSAAAAMKTEKEERKIIFIYEYASQMFLFTAYECNTLVSVEFN